MFLNNSPYENHPGFYDQDNRKTRALSPINREQLENRHAAMFAEWNLAGKTILDLGSCMGATGQWVLHKGAKHYTGVEAQDSYVAQSRNLLSHHGDKVEIIQESIEDFLDKNTKKYDIVVMLGVIYGFIDYYSILKKATNICKENLLIEGIYPYPPTGNPNAPVVEIVEKQPMVIADKEQNIQGLGARMSPRALDIIMGSLGFEAIGKHPMPRRMSTDLDNFCGNPQEKFFVRFLTSYRNTEHVARTVSDALLSPINSDGIQNWKDIEKNRHYVDPNQQILGKEPWTFDEKVANNFPDEAQSNIPDYDRVINKSLSLAEKFLDKTSNIIDVGSSLGETLKRFSEKGFVNLNGVDNSIHMIERAYQNHLGNIKYYHSEKFPIKKDFYSLVLANWTLHFIDERESYLEDIFNSIALGGYLILTEKILQSEETSEQYKDFKREKGLSEQYIQYKDEALRGVLVSYPLEWYLVTLRKIGFRHIEIFNSNLGFTSFLVKK